MRPDIPPDLGLAVPSTDYDPVPSTGISTVYAVTAPRTFDSLSGLTMCQRIPLHRQHWNLVLFTILVSSTAKGAQGQRAYKDCPRDNLAASLIPRYIQELPELVTACKTFARVPITMYPSPIRATFCGDPKGITRTASGEWKFKEKKRSQSKC